MTTKPPPVTQLDLAKVGLVFVNLVAASSMAGHAHIWDTVRDYVDATAGESPEAAFVRDAFQLQVGDAAAKWFGSELAAQAYAVNLVADNVESGDQRAQ